jgi:hypothetical protein
MDLAPAFLLIASGDAAEIVRYAIRPDILGILIPISAIIMGGLIIITKMVLRHRERIAKIEMGIDPDAPPRTNDESQSSR